jgi:nitrile hydratase accessory protein
MDQKPDTPLLAKGLPLGFDAEATFAEPWEAKAFAIVIKLAEAGHFTWPEWVECFAKEVAAATAVEAAGGRPKTYYEQWLDAAERIMIEKGVTSKEQIVARRFALGVTGPAHVLK